MLQDRIILITGIANDRSLAAAVAGACAAQGAQLVCTWQSERQERRLRSVVAAIQPDALCCHLDVRDAASIAAAMDQIAARHGRLDGLLHAIAYARLADDQGGRRPLTAIDDDDWQEALAISARSLPQLVAAADGLLSTGAHVVALSYEGARRVHPGYDLMGVAKAALEAATRYLAQSCGDRQIHVNAISAGSVRTVAAAAVPGAAARRERLAAVAPLGRGVTAEEVGQAAAFLLAPMSNGITGQVIHVDAGLSIMGA